MYENARYHQIVSKRLVLGMFDRLHCYLLPPTMASVGA